MSINVITTCTALRELVDDLKRQGRRIGVVPTMGALHEGHLSLVRESIAQADETITTIFLNPTQFAPGEDLSNYPKPLEQDLTLLSAAGVKYVFAPAAGEMYPAGFSTAVTPPAICKKLEGEFRPSHFAGVATVVLKLLNLTGANLAFFGQKDYQQVLVIQRMVEDLNVPVEIKVCPIVREADGLAMSSRNVYLTAEERAIALSLSRTLDQIESMIRGGVSDGFEIITEMRQGLIDGGVEKIDYAVIADPRTLETLDPIELPAIALVAAFVGTTRLIDNRLIV